MTSIDRGSPEVVRASGAARQLVTARDGVTVDPKTGQVWIAILNEAVEEAMGDRRFAFALLACLSTLAVATLAISPDRDDPLRDVYDFLDYAGPL